MAFNLARIFNHSVCRRAASTHIAPKTPLPLCFFTDEESAIKDSVTKFANESVAPLVREMENKGKFDPIILRDLFKNGLMSIETPVEYGGVGASATSSTIAIEELAKVDPSVSIIVAIHNALVINLIKKLGTAEQKSTYLPQLAESKIGCFCLSEASSGSDAFAMKTTAKADGDDYLLNGSKMWISNADVGEIFIVFANANPSAGYRGISAFIVEKSFPGLTVGPSEIKLGLKASGTCPVHFDNVRVPKGNVIGEICQGYRYAAGSLNESRVGVAAQMLGIAQGCFDLTVPYTLERKQFGNSIFDFQGMQHQIADIATRLEGARLLTYNASRMLEAGLPFAKYASMAKYNNAELAQEVTRKCIDWLGGVGFTTAFLQEKFYRDCKVGTIYEGSSNMQLSTIAKLIRKEYE